MINLKYYILGLFLVFGVGFYFGKKSVKVEASTKYIKGKTIKDSIPYERLVPKTIVLPSLLTYIELSDSGSTITTTQPKDTAESLKMVLNDWNTERAYNDVLFSDSTIGTFKYNAKVQFNKLSSFKYEYTPITKVETKVIKRTSEPFVSAEYSTLNTVGVGGGFFYHNLGLELMYNKDFINGNNGVSFGVKIKF